MSFSTSFKLFAVVVVTGSVLSQSPVFAQDERRGPPPGRERDRQRERMFDDDPAALRARLERRLEFVHRQQEELESALAELAARKEARDDEQPVEADVPDDKRRRGRRSDRPMGRGAGLEDEPGERRKNIELILDFLQDHNPEMAKRVREAIRENPRAAEGIIRRLAPRIDEIRDLRERDPAMARLRTAELTNSWALMRAGRQLREAFHAETRDRETIRALRETIKEHVTRQFEIRARIQQHEIELLQERIEHIKASTEEMMKNRDDIIAGHVDRIFNDAQKTEQRRERRRDR